MHDHALTALGKHPTRSAPQLGRAAQAWQRQLDKRLAAADIPADEPWRQLLAAEVPNTTADPFLPELTEMLRSLTRADFDATLLVRSAAAARPLPDDHPAAALWYSILDQLPQTPSPDSATSGESHTARSADLRRPI